MKARISISLGLLLLSGALTTARADPAIPDVSASVQAIQQAPDPSAAVAAYANGFAAGKDNNELNRAYISRLIDLGMPELAYRQAQSLSSTAPKSGLAWAVLAYVDARRGDMPSAVSNIIQASDLMPEHPFIQRTAGEIVAWFDSRGNQTSLPQNSVAGLSRVRGNLGNQPRFTEAYNAAKNAYANQPGSTLEPPPPAPVPQAAIPAPPSPVYQPDLYSAPVYYDDSAYWWQPTGWFWGGTFLPCGFIAFNHARFHHAHRDHGHFHNGWHADGHGRNAFFGQRSMTADPPSRAGRSTSRIASVPNVISPGRTTTLGGPRITFMAPSRTASPSSAPQGRSVSIPQGRSVSIPQGRSVSIPQGNSVSIPQGRGSGLAQTPAAPSVRSFQMQAPSSRGSSGGGSSGGFHSGGAGFHGGGGGGGHGGGGHK